VVKRRTIETGVGIAAASRPAHTCPYGSFDPAANHAYSDRPTRNDRGACRPPDNRKAKQPSVLQSGAGYKARGKEVGTDDSVPELR
jgi:hypothetical protein